jgi:hypothetical protein
MYFFLVYFFVGFIGPTKLSPHFIIDSLRRIVTSLDNFYVANLLVC